MRRYIDNASILTEARMMWSDYKKSYVLVEGESDKLFLSLFLDKKDSILIRVVNGWENVRDTIMLAQSNCFPQIIGIIDKDYHAILNDGVEPCEQLLFTDEKDLEMMLFLSGAFDKFLRVCGSNDKVCTIENPRAVLESAAFPIGILRMISLSKGYNLLFDGLKIKDFVDKNDLSINIDEMIRVVLQRTRSNGTQVLATEEELKNSMKNIIKCENKTDYCNGHDIFDIICLSMTKLFASYSTGTFNSDDIFRYLLVGYSKEDFFRTALYNDIKAHLKKHSLLQT